VYAFWQPITHNTSTFFKIADDWGKQITAPGES
jgi:hypothetical protein